MLTNINFDYGFKFKYLYAVNLQNYAIDFE